MKEQLGYQVGQVVGAVAARYESNKTKPPPRYTEASLIADMINAHKFAASDAERKILRETEGLGTSRTREPTISSLITRRYVTSTKRGKSHELVSEPLARSVVANLPDYLSGVATTAKWEVAFSMIESGKVPPEAVRAKVNDLLEGLVEDAKVRQAAGKLKAVGAQLAKPPARGPATAAKGQGNRK